MFLQVDDILVDLLTDVVFESGRDGGEACHDEEELAKLVLWYFEIPFVLDMPDGEEAFLHRPAFLDEFGIVGEFLILLVFLTFLCFVAFVA